MSFRRNPVQQMSLFDTTVKAGNVLTTQVEIHLFACLNANLYAIYIQFSRFLEKRRFTSEGFEPYIILSNTHKD